MKVMCVNEKISIENNSQRLIEWVNNSELEITTGKTYLVLAISKYIDVFFYYILGDESDNYPLAFPSELFQIIDNRVSNCWSTNLTKIESLEDIYIENGEILSFKEWTLNKDNFYENLLNETKYELTIFNNYKNEMVCEDMITL